MLNVAAALALPAPVADPYEPNEDIDQVSPSGDRYVARVQPLTTTSRRTTRIVGRVDAYEDPRDVYRTWLPAGQRFTATLTSSSDGDLALYSNVAQSVVGRFATTGRLAVASTRGTRERLVYANGKRGRWTYIVVRLPSGTLDATYQLRVANAVTKR
jgi:hypothetical protein